MLRQGSREPFPPNSYYGFFREATILDRPWVCSRRDGGWWCSLEFRVDPCEERPEYRDLDAEVGQGEEGDGDASRAIHGRAADMRGVPGEPDLDHLERHGRQERTRQHRTPRAVGPYRVRGYTIDGLAARPVTDSVVAVSLVLATDASVGGVNRSMTFFIVDLWRQAGGTWQVVQRYSAFPEAGSASARAVTGE